MGGKISIQEFVAGSGGKFNDLPDIVNTRTGGVNNSRQVERAMSNVTEKVNDNKVGSTNLEQRAAKLSEVFSGGGMRDYERIKPYLDGLSPAEAKQLQTIYRQKTGRDLLKDADFYLPLDTKIRAFERLAPERVHHQTEPLGLDTGGKGIKMNPPTKEVLTGSEVEYTLDLQGETGGGRRVSHLIQGEQARIEEEGAGFKADYSRVEGDGTYRATFQVKYNNDLPEFYTYDVKVSKGETKAANELNNLEATSPDSELYLNYLDGQIADIRQAITELETKRDSINNDIRSGNGNSAAKYTEVRGIEDQLKTLKSKLPEMETARAEVAKALTETGEKPIPLKAVLIARENGQTIPLQLYAKNLGDGKWAIVDVTNPSKPRTWTGEGALPADALDQAWKNFVGGTNDLPAGQIAAFHPPGLGFQTGANWNAASLGTSSLKSWSNRLGAGSIALVVLAGAAAIATEGAAIPLLLASGVLGGASAGFNAADRINNGTFRLKSTETALDLLGIAGGIASVGGLASLTGAGRAILANGAKFTVQNLGNVTRIVQVAERGANVAGSILIANQYVSAMDEISRSAMSPEQKATATRQIIAQAIAAGGLMILGVGIGRKIAQTTETELSVLLKEAKLGGSLEQTVKNNEAVQKFFVEYGKEELNTAYNEYLLGTKTGRLKAKSFEDYLEQRVVSLTTGRRTLDSHEGVSGVIEGKDIGHGILKHVGKSERWLQNRVRNEGVREASSFYNYEVGNRTIGNFKKQYETEINQWLKSKDTEPFKATIDMEENIGLVVSRSKKGTPLPAEKATKAEVILVKDNSQWGWHLFTVKLKK